MSSELLSNNYLELHAVYEAIAYLNLRGYFIGVFTDN